MIPNQLLQGLNAIKANPMQFLMRRRLNFPQNISVNDPNAILNYLVQSGQISQQAVNNAYQMMQNFR